jgi:hypothetical protein
MLVNIFALDSNPERAARMHCDRHVVKMVLETAQLLSTTCHARNVSLASQLTALGLCYRPTHWHHPCTLWVMHSQGNLAWLERLGLALCKEYTYRYGKVHASEKVIRALVEAETGAEGKSYHCLLRRRTPFVQVLPLPYIGDDPVTAYRHYYIAEKAPICRWTRRQAPSGFTAGGQVASPVAGRT